MHIIVEIATGIRHMIIDQRARMTGMAEGRRAMTTNMRGGVGVRVDMPMEEGEGGTMMIVIRCEGFEWWSYTDERLAFAIWMPLTRLV